MSGPIYQFEEFTVDAGERVIQRGGEPRTLTPKAFDVLLALVERHGSLVGKEELLNLVWPDTFVEETNLTYTISLLRKALADSAENSKFIETVPKRGYRFIATVIIKSPIPPPAPAVRPATAEPALERASATGTALSLRVIAALTLVICAYLGVRFGFPAPARTIEARNIVPFTSFPGGEYEPAFSPDGARIAFVWRGEREENYDIYIKTVSFGAVTRLTTNAAGHGSPAWSPDGRSIAFVQYSPIREDNGVFIVPASGGLPRRLTSLHPVENLFASHLDWSPDGKYLAVVDKKTDAEPFSIYLLTVETGARRQLTFPPKQSLGDTGPRFAPDSASVVFGRAVTSGVHELYSCLVNRSGDPKRLTFANSNIFSHAWMSDGRALIYSDAGGFWRQPASGGAPHSVPGLPGGANYIAVSKQGNRVAFSQWFADTNVWRIPLGPIRGSAGPRALIESTRDERSAQYSPDGAMIAFRSDRSGSSEIWLSDAQGENPVQLTSFGGPLTGTPRWSPDGLQIAFDSRPDGNADIYSLRIASGALRRLTHGLASNVVPSWSADGRWIYFSSNRTGAWQVWKIASESTDKDAVPLQVTRNGGFAPLESPNGKMLYYAKDQDAAGLWQVPVSGGPETAVIPQLKSGYWGYWAPAPGGESIYFIDTEADTAAVYAYTIETRTISKVTALPTPPPFGDSGFSVSPDSHWIIYTKIDRSVSDIMLAEIKSN